MCERKIGLQRKPRASFDQLDSAATHADDFMASSDETSMAKKKAGTLIAAMGQKRRNVAYTERQL